MQLPFRKSGGEPYTKESDGKAAALGIDAGQDVLLAAAAIGSWRSIGIR
jgi:hypothetical protein